MLINTETRQPWRGEATKDGLRHPRSIEALWSEVDLATAGLVPVKLFSPPDGEQIVPGSKPTYDASGQQTFPTEPTPPPPPRQIRKTTVIHRMLTTFGEAAVVNIYNSMSTVQLIRWNAGDVINTKDPDMNALLEGAGLTAEQIDALLAPEN